jgi:hypothetical protein
MGASWGSMPNRAEPMHLRISTMVAVLSSLAADLATGCVSITHVWRRCKVEVRHDNRLEEQDRRPR